MKGKNYYIKNYIIYTESYRVALKFLRELNFADWRLIFSVLWELIFAIEEKNWFFLLRINLCDFLEVAFK